MTVDYMWGSNELVQLCRLSSIMYEAVSYYIVLDRTTNYVHSKIQFVELTSILFVEEVVHNIGIGRNGLFVHIIMVVVGISSGWFWGQGRLFVKREEVMTLWHKRASHIAGPFVCEIHRWSMESPLKGK